MVTTVRAASSAMLSVALAPRKAAEAPPKAVRREVAVQEAALRVAAAHVEVVIPQESRIVVVVAPAAMTTTTITHRVAVAEGEGDSIVTKPTKLAKPFFNILGGQRHPTGMPLLTPTKVGR